MGLIGVRFDGEPTNQTERGSPRDKGLLWSEMTGYNSRRARQIKSRKVHPSALSEIDFHFVPLRMSIKYANAEGEGCILHPYEDIVITEKDRGPKTWQFCGRASWMAPCHASSVLSRIKGRLRNLIGNAVAMQLACVLASHSVWRGPFCRLSHSVSRNRFHPGMTQKVNENL